VSDLEAARKLADENAIITEWKAQGNGDIPVSRDFANRYLADIVNQLISFSKLYHVKELDELWKEVPHERYLPLSFREEGVLRDKLYERLLSPGWDTIRANVTAQQFPKIIDDVREAWSLKDAAPDMARSKWDALVERGVVRDDMGMYSPDVAKTIEYAVDHDPPLAKHWVLTGHNSLDEDRRAVASGDSSVLTLVTRRFNSQKGSEGYKFLSVPWVEPGFRHLYAQNNAPEALTIDGEPFLDATGKPLG
jgi:hypothetical protein